jgi:hypothetical protein
MEISIGIAEIRLILNASHADLGRAAFSRILHRLISCVFVALCIAMVCSPLVTFAQEDLPQIIPGERKPKQKKDLGPRAVGVLQMNANGKGSLVPIAILINGKFWDASAYKADPVPMALDYGTVYEAERSGNSLGLFTVGSALHRNSAADSTQPPWIGTGTWHANGSEPETKSAKAEAVPVGIDAGTGSGPPRLTRDPTKMDKPPDSATPAASKPSDTPSSTSSKPASGSSDEPPRLSKPASPPDSQPSPTPAPSADKGPTDKPKADSGKADQPKADNQAKIPASDSGTSEANRPRLRYGKPAESFADEDVPGYSKPGMTPAKSDLSKAGPVATEGDVQLIPAISDAHGPDLHSFVFQWLKGEEDDRRKQMTELAKEQVRAYIAARAREAIGAKPRATAARGGAKMKDPVLEDVRMVAYDVWLSNQPVIVLSAEAHMPAPQGWTAQPDESQMQYWVMIVAYPDIYNNLHKLYVGVTDKFHLDVTPRLQLIDAVDADGDGRGELLFREISDQGTGWVIYRPTADKLWKMYDSLRPE